MGLDDNFTIKPNDLP